MKEYEEKILGAEDKILVLETQLYAELVQSLSEFIMGQTTVEQAVQDVKTQAQLNIDKIIME